MGIGVSAEAASEQMEDENVVEVMDDEATEVNGDDENEGSSENDKEEEEEEEASQEDSGKRIITAEDIKTAPMDFRFPTTNQSKHCFTRYNEYHKCVGEKGEGNPACTKYARYYRSLCPAEWIEKWNEQRENGTFPGPY